MSQTQREISRRYWEKLRADPVRLKAYLIKTAARRQKRIKSDPAFAQKLKEYSKEYRGRRQKQNPEKWKEQQSRYARSEKGRLSRKRYYQSLMKDPIKLARHRENKRKFMARLMDKIYADPKKHDLFKQSRRERYWKDAWKNYK